jgi:hypothetical protein
MRNGRISIKKLPLISSYFHLFPHISGYPKLFIFSGAGGFGIGRLPDIPT